jgi:hypothetical protein
MRNWARKNNRIVTYVVLLFILFWLGLKAMGVLSLEGSLIQVITILQLIVVAILAWILGWGKNV